MKQTDTIEPSPTPSFLEALLEDAPETLPILRQSCIQVLNLTQDKHSSASDIGDIIKRDQAMMANIVKIANSTAYSTRVPVKTPTHAVALIGFDVIQAMAVAAQIIEQADRFGAKTFCLKRILARALVAGTHAQEIGKAINYPEPGFLFTNAMLSSLGELILGLCRPDIAEQLEAIRLDDHEKVPKAELALLGRPLQTIAATMAKHWHLPDSLVQLLEKKAIWPTKPPEHDQQTMETIVRAANELSYCLMNPMATGQEKIFKAVVRQFLPPFCLSFPQLEDVVKKAFLQASEIASAIHIHPTHIIPTTESDHIPIQNPQLQKLTQAIQATLQPDDPEPNKVQAASAPSPLSKQPHAPSTLNKDHQLVEFTLAAMKVPEPSKLLTLATHTLYTSCGFARVLLAFAVPGKEQIEGKISYGEQGDAIQAAFHCPLIKGNFWHYLLHQYQPIQFLSLSDHNQTNEVPPNFQQLWGQSPGLAGSLYTPNKPIGLILADRGSEEHIDEQDFAAFSLILAQTNANLARLAQSQ